MARSLRCGTLKTSAVEMTALRPMGDAALPQISGECGKNGGTTVQNFGTLFLISPAPFFQDFDSDDAGRRRSLAHEDAFIDAPSPIELPGGVGDSSPEHHGAVAGVGSRPTHRASS